MGLAVALAGVIALLFQVSLRRAEKFPVGPRSPEPSSPLAAPSPPPPPNPKRQAGSVYYALSPSGTPPRVIVRTKPVIPSARHHRREHRGGLG